MKKRIRIIIPVFIIASIVLYYKFYHGQSGSAHLLLSGNIDVTDARLSFKISGRLRERPVEEGDKVKKGDLIARLDDTDQKLMVSQAQANKIFYEAALRELEAGSRKEEIRKAHARLEHARFALQELEKGSRDQEIADAKAELERAKAGEKMQLSNLTLAQSDYNRYEELKNTGAVSLRDLDHYRIQLEKATSAYKEAKAQVQSAQERLSLRKEGPRQEEIDRAKAALQQAEADYALIKEGTRSETIEKAKAQVAIAEESLRNAKQQLEYTELFAPFDGVVLSKGAEPGEYLTPGAPVVTIADLDHVWMRAYVNEKFLNRIKIGKEAEVITDAYPDRKFKGKIIFISSEAEFTPKTVQTHEERVKLVFRIKIELENPDWELKPGMPADAIIQNEA